MLCVKFCGSTLCIHLIFITRVQLHFLSLLGLFSELYVQELQAVECSLSSISVQARAYIDVAKGLHGQCQ